MDVTAYAYAIEPPMINNQGTVYFRAAETISTGSMLLYVKLYYLNMSPYIWTHRNVEHCVYEPVMNDRNQVPFRWNTANGIAMFFAAQTPRVWSSPDLVLGVRLSTICFSARRLRPLPNALT